MRAYRYVVDIPDPVDLAVIVFPADVVDRALEQCGKKGIQSAIVISAGFPRGRPRGRRARGAAQATSPPNTASPWSARTAWA